MPSLEFHYVGQDRLPEVPNGPRVASVIEIQQRAAVDRLGIVYSFGEFLRPALDNGTLVPILHDW